MNRREWLSAAFGILLLSLSAVFLLRERIPANDIVLTQACGMPVRILDPHVNEAVPTAVVFHGLGANAVVMRSLGEFLGRLGMRVYLLDLPGHGSNEDHFSFEHVEDCAAKSLSALEQRGEIRTDNTVLLGHSMGGALAIRMADYFPTAATIAISPAPMIRMGRMPKSAVLWSPPRRIPVNLLIVMGKFDFPYSRESAEELIRMGGGQRSEPNDFLQKRALKLVTVLRATHTSLIFNLPNASPLASWIAAALSGRLTPLDAPVIKPELWGVLGLLGLFLLFPLAANGIARVFKLHDSAGAVSAISTPRAILYWIAAAFLAVTALKFNPQYNFLRMQYGGYLASCLLLAGIVLLLFLKTTAKSQLAKAPAHARWRGVLAGALMGVATILAFGLWMNLQLSDTWLNAPRWMRFFPAVSACLPYALAEEWALGAPSAGSWFASTRRYLLFGVLRLLIWLSILLALYVYSSGQILLSVLVFYMGLFSLLTKVGADAVRRRTGSIAGAAVFTAILMGWFIAAVFPIT